VKANGASPRVEAPAFRLFGVVTLATIALALTLPSLVRLSPGTFYTYGLSIDRDGAVTQSFDGLPAALAGIRAGDRVDLGAMPFAQRAAVLNGITAKKGTVDLTITSGASTRTVSLNAVTENLSPTFKLTLLLRQLLGVLFIALGVAVVFRRPSISTWAFFLYCLRINGSSILGALALAPTWLILPTFIINDVLAAVGIVSFVVFTLYFPERDSRGWRLVCERALPYILILMLALWLPSQVLPYGFGIGSQGLGTALFLFAIAFVVLGYLVLADTYGRSRGVVRQQVKWVFLGFGIAICAALVGVTVASHSAWLPFRLSPLLVQAVFLGVAAGPLSVAYAIFRHHVLDVNFVISRTLAYAVITAVLIAGFSVLDFVLHQIMASTRLALVAELGAAVAAGFWMEGLHRAADRLVDRTLFHRRYEAELRLARAAAGLSHAGSHAAVDSMLIHEPLDALQLTSGALFRLKDGAFQRTAADAWGSGCSSSLDADDPLVLHMQGKHEAIDFAAAGRTTLRAPHGFGRPILVLPLVARHQIVGFALYGAHVNGERLNPDEIQTLEQLLSAAGAAYDHLEVVSMRQRCESLERRLAHFERTAQAPALH
jgi:hypothetical protein